MCPLDAKQNKFTWLSVDRAVIINGCAVDKLLREIGKLRRPVSPMGYQYWNKYIMKITSFLYYLCSVIENIGVRKGCSVKNSVSIKFFDQAITYL